MENVNYETEYKRLQERYNELNEELKECRSYERYDYKSAVLEDVKQYIREHYEAAEFIEKVEDDREELECNLNEACWTDDSVTGNASGSYTFNSWKAEQYVCHNFDLLCDALSDFGYDSYFSVLSKGAEWCDVTIRCYLLGQVIPQAIDEMTDEWD